MASRLFFYCGLAFSVIAMLTIAIGVATPNWLEANERAGRGFQKLGLWEACFKGFTYIYDYTNTIYDGCWGMFSKEYSPIHDWLNPGWFVDVQVLAVLSLICQLAALICLIMILVGCWTCFANRPVAEQISWVVISLDLILAGTLGGSCCIVFAANSVGDHQWLPNPDSNFRSWSFAMVCVSSASSAIAGSLILIEAIRIRIAYNRRKPPRYTYEMRPTRRY